MRGKKSFLLSSTTLLLFSAPAFAQEVDETTAGGRTLDTIVVTAEKRESNVQDTPISLTAVTSDAIDANGDVTVEDIALTTPGLVVGGNAAFEYSVSIRGIASAIAGVGADTPTGTYIDGVYIGRPVGAIFDLADVDRVEILRGPQGTLYGRNTVGGAVSVYSKRPSDSFEGNFKGTIAERGIRRFSGGLSGPIIADKLNGRVSASYSEVEPWVENLTGPDILGTESLIVRGALEFIPNDYINVLLRADYGDVEDPLYGKNITEFVRDSDPASGTVLPPQTDTSLIPRFDVVSHSETSAQSREFFGFSLEANIDIGDLTLTSITAYRDNEHIYDWDTDGSPLRIFRSGHLEEQDQFSQELRLASPGGQAIDWIVGAYYFTESAHQDFYVENFTVPGNFARFSDNKTESVAVFGQADWNATDKLTATLGLRYSYETKDFGFAFQPTIPLTAAQIGDPFSPLNRLPRTVPFNQDSENWDAVTGKVGLSYQASDDVLLYASVAQGFKSGGFNFAPRNPAGDPPFDQEENLAYELGVKSDLFDGRARLNAAAFFYDYENLQVRVPIEPGVFQVRNASDAEIYGGEIEFEAQPIDRLYIQASLALLQTEYVDFLQIETIPAFCVGGISGTANPDGGDPNDPSDDVPTCDVSGNELNRAPNYTFNVAVEYAIPMPGGSTLTPRLSYAYEDDVFYTEQNDPRAGHDGYETLDALLTYRTPNENFSISVFGRNLTDDRVYTHVIPIGTAGIASGVNQPRTFGVSFDLDF